MTVRATPFAILTIGLFVGCWTGADSRGLPCETNTHCGLGLDCISGFCGGEGLCGNGLLDPGEACDEGGQNSDQGGCTLACTLARCGDGLLGPGEACDDGNAEIGDGCTPACTLELCGNGVLEPGETCDAGGESPSCNANCTPAMCGDAVVNAAAGENCDPGLPLVDGPECMSNCTLPLLWDDLEPSTAFVNWTHATVSGGLPSTWVRSDRNLRPGSTLAWDSGVPAASTSDMRLMTPDLELGPFAGETIELRFDHARVFSDCNKPMVAYEGAVVEVSVDGGAYEVIEPQAMYPGVVGDGLCFDSALVDQLAFILDSGYRTEVFDLSAYAGSSIKLGFRAAWDCGNCNEPNQLQRGWFIDNVVVARK